MQRFHSSDWKLIFSANVNSNCLVLIDSAGANILYSLGQLDKDGEEE